MNVSLHDGSCGCKFRNEESDLYDLINLPDREY